MKKLILITVFYISCINVFASDTLTFSYVDSATYSMYQKQEWEPLINLGNKAIENNIDYYDLRIRIGIAYFEQKAFLNSLPNFEKALEFNKESEIALEYKYYALLYSYKTREASYFAKTLPNILIKKINPTLPKLIDKIIIETGFNNVPKLDSKEKAINIQEINTDMDLTPNYYWQWWVTNARIEKDVAGEYKFSALSFNHEFNKKFSFYHSIKLFKYSVFQQLWANNSIINENNYTLNSRQYYFAPTYYDNKKNSYALFGNLIYQSSKSNLYKFNRVYFDAPKHTIYDLPIESKTVELWQWVTGLNFSRYFKNYNVIDITTTVSKLNNLIQIQLSSGYGFYLNKKKTIFTKSTLTLFNQEEIFRPSFLETIKFKIKNYICIELIGSVGKLKNYNENNGYIIFNTFDETLYRLGTNISFNLNKKMNLLISYTLFKNNLPFRYISAFPGTGIQNEKYYQHLISVAISWKF